MKRVAFVVSHLGADSAALCQILDKNPRVQFFQTNTVYDGIGAIEGLVSHEHKLKNVAAIWLDELLYNHYFANKCLYRCAKFIYLIREAKPTLNGIVKEKWETDHAHLYYMFRLRRIYEMARKTPGAVLLTHDDLITGRGFPLVEEYLSLKQPLEQDDSLLNKVRSYNPLVSPKNLEVAQQSYERYLYLIRQMPIKSFSFSR